MQTKQQHRVVLLNPILAAVGGRAAPTIQEGVQGVHPCPTAATRDAAPSKESRSQTIWQPALSFRNKLSWLESREQPAGFLPKSPVTKQLAEALRE